MSPEQARGLDVDARTDVWAFGCVLFEMLAGRKAFSGDTAADTTARILEQELDWSLLPKSTPAIIRRLLRQCLQKDRRRRLQTAAEARVIIEQFLAPRALSRRAWMAIAAAAVFALSVAAFLWSQLDRRPAANRSEWVQLTNLDSVTQPALSPDGRMLAFLRGPSTFTTPGELYVKMLPDGEPIPLTNDALPKMGPVFSPDGSRIAYTVNDGNSWDTWEVPTLRGEARLWLRNASGLTWAGPNDLLFSEIKQAIHMAIVRTPESRVGSRDVYLPPHESGMAHRSQLSPDGNWVLVVEMDERGYWVACRLQPTAGGPSRVVGPPQARCTNVAWTPDGRWMYFSADAGDGYHIWRQRFPDGPLEQITSGPTEEEGLAFTLDGKALITSVGLTQRSVWVQDSSGERQISLEGYGFLPLLSADGRKVLFRITRGVAMGQSPSELWVADVGSGQKHRLFPGQLVTTYDASSDGRVVAAVVESDGKTGIWLTGLDGREAPRRIPNGDGHSPRFGRDGEILFRAVEANRAFLYRIREDGTGRQKFAEARGSVVGPGSPDGEWVGVSGSDGLTLHSTSGRPPIVVFPSQLAARLRWAVDGKYAYLSIQYGQASAFAYGRTYALPLAPGSVLPSMPPGGFRTEADVAAVPGVRILPYGDVGPGPSPSTYAFSRVTSARNLYRIPLE
jgi:Tol biopolymer transport system component